MVMVSVSPQLRFAHPQPVKMLSPTQDSVRAAISSVANVVVCDVLLDGVDTLSMERAGVRD